jgi:hypothetical protein
MPHVQNTRDEEELGPGFNPVVMAVLRPGSVTPQRGHVAAWSETSRPHSRHFVSMAHLLDARTDQTTLCQTVCTRRDLVVNALACVNIDDEKFSYARNVHRTDR